MITEQSIREAYIFLRTHNQSIPDETLDFMLKASLAALKKDNPLADFFEYRSADLNEIKSRS